VSCKLPPAALQGLGTCNIDTATTMTNCGMYDTADLRIKAELTYCTCTGQNNQIDPKTNAAVPCTQELSLLYI
jgi:hypothetical protein